MKINLPSAETINRAGHYCAPIERPGTDATALGKIVTRWIRVTPAMAADWLKNNLVNRELSRHTVEAYARDMRNGDFIPTHQGIAFNDAEELIDGQHKLSAIVKTGLTILLMVTFGLPKKIAGKNFTVMDVVDRGRTRTVADQLKIAHGLKNGGDIAKISSALAGLCHESARRLSVGNVLSVYDAFRGPMDFVMTERSKEPGLKAAGVLAAFVFALVDEDGSILPLPPKPIQAFRAFNTGDGLDLFPVVKLLREKLTGQNAKIVIAQMNRGLAEVTAQALYLEGCGRRVEKLEPSLEGVNHFRAAHGTRVDKIAALFKLPPPTTSPEELEKHSAQLKAAHPLVEKQSRVSASIGAPAPGSRPSLETLAQKVEAHTKISWFIISGRGRDPEIDLARIVFIQLARGVGHTADATAGRLHRTEEQIRDYTLAGAALTTKQEKAVATIKSKL